MDTVSIQLEKMLNSYQDNNMNDLTAYDMNLTYPLNNYFDVSNNRTTFEYIDFYDFKILDNLNISTRQADIYNFDSSYQNSDLTRKANELLYFFIINFAYSCKLIIYLIFCRHLKCFFEISKKIEV